MDNLSYLKHGLFQVVTKQNFTSLLSDTARVMCVASMHH